MDIKKEIKKLLIEENITLSDVVRKLNEKNNTEYTVQAYTNKIYKGTLRVNELEDILNIIGYKIELTKDLS